MEQGTITMKLKFYALFGYLIFFGLKAYALTNFDQPQLFSMGINQNAGFESDKAFWTQTSGQAFFVVSTASEVGTGLKSAKLMGPTLQRIKQDLVPLPNSMKSSATCMIRCEWRNPSGAAASCYAEDQAGVLVAGSTIAFTAGAGWQSNQATFTCPASGSIRVVIEATPASGQSVWADQAYLGPAPAPASGGGGLSPALNQDWIFVGNALNVATGVPMTGDVSIVASGATAIADTVVTGKLLTGLGAGVNTPILATDSILQAFANLQAQISAFPSGPFIPLAGSSAITGSLAPNMNSLYNLGVDSTNVWSTLFTESVKLGIDTGALANIGLLRLNTTTLELSASQNTDILISTGNLTFNPNGTDVEIRTGSGGGGLQTTGDILLTTGDSTGGSSVSGGIYLTTGSAPSGTQGSIYMSEASLGAASNGYVWTLQNNLDGQGAWVASGLVEANTIASPDDVTALEASTNGISPTLTAQRTVWNLQGDSAARNMTAPTQINGCNGGNSMKELVLRGVNSTNTVTFNAASDLLLQSASKTLGNGGTLQLYCDGTNWVEF